MVDQLWPVIGPGAGWAAFLMLSFLVLRAVVKGDLIPRSTHEEKAHEANEWRAEGRIKDQAIIATLDQVKNAVEEQGETLHHFIASLQKVADVPPADRDRDRP